jgi:hypothetical protein
MKLRDAEFEEYFKVRLSCVITPEMIANGTFNSVGFQDYNSGRHVAAYVAK